MDIDTTEQIELKNIAKSLINQRVMFVCGAGMSVESGIPAFKHVVMELLRRKFKDLPPEKIEELSVKFNPEAIIAWYISGKPEKLRDEEFREELTTILGDKYCEPNEGHKAVQYFFGEQLINRIYTTNLEFLLEKCFKGAGKSVTDKDIPDLKEIMKEECIAVIHLHGHLEEDIAITEEKTFSTDTLCFREFIHDFLYHDYVIFIGHSFNDQDIRQVIFQSMVKAKQLGIPMPEFVAVWKVEDEIEKTIAEGVWETRGFSFFSCGATKFLENLKEELAYVKQEEALNKLSDKLGESVIIIRDRAKKIEQTFEYFQEGDGIRYLARTFLGEDLP